MVMVQEVATKCPYTGKEMRDPVKNIHCKHNYDREGITAAMKLRKGKTRCVKNLFLKQNKQKFALITSCNCHSHPSAIN